MAARQRFRCTAALCDPVQHLEARVAFAVAGTGIALLPSFAITEPLASGALIQVLPDISATVPLALIWPSSQHLSPRVRAFSQYLSTHLRPFFGH